MSQQTPTLSLPLSGGEKRERRARSVRPGRSKPPSHFLPLKGGGLRWGSRAAISVLFCVRARPHYSSVIPVSSTHEIRHRPTYRRTRFARAALRQARRFARASRFGHARPDALARCAGRMRRHQDRRRFRAAAWPARRQAGQHDRVAGLQRSGARHPGLQPVWQSAQADRCDDGYLRCHPRRPAGFGLPDLYVHHDAALYARSGVEASTKRCGCWIGPILSAGRSKA